VLAYGYFNQKAEERAFLLLDQAVARYTTELVRQDAAKALEVVASDFETLLADYGERQAGAVGRVLFAQMNYRAGRAEAAATQYEAALPHFREDAYAAAAALSGLGYARAAAGEPERAIAAFSKILDGADPVFKADALYQMALLYRATGQDGAYEKAIRQLESDYPDFIYADVLPSAAAGG
jgi:tetratricopeptide (TPR) repeat protein